MRYIVPPSQSKEESDRLLKGESAAEFVHVKEGRLPMSSFVNSSIFFLQAGHSIDITLWFGQGDDRGAVFAMGSTGAITYGPVLNTDPPPVFNLETSGFSKSEHFSLATGTAEGVTSSDPFYHYRFTVKNVGALDAYFKLQGMTSA